MLLLLLLLLYTVFGWDFVDNFIIRKRRKTDTVFTSCFFSLFFEIQKCTAEVRGRGGGRYERGFVFLLLRHVLGDPVDMKQAHKLMARKQRT